MILFVYQTLKLLLRQFSLSYDKSSETLSGELPVILFKLQGLLLVQDESWLEHVVCALANQKDLLGLFVLNNHGHALAVRVKFKLSDDLVVVVLIQLLLNLLNYLLHHAHHSPLAAGRQFLFVLILKQLVPESNCATFFVLQDHSARTRSFD